MRDLIIARIKQRIDWRNEQFSWNENYIPEKYPDFDRESDEALLSIYENIPGGPCG